METIIIILVIAAIIWFKFGRLILEFISAMRHKDFTYNPKKRAELSLDQTKAISAGLIIAEQNMFYADTLETGANKNNQSKRLSTAWGVYSKESALARLDTFGTAHQLYDAAIDTYLNAEKNEWQNYIENHFPEDSTEEIIECLTQLDDISKLLITEEVASNEQEITDILKRGSIAWDLGRIVYIARASYTVGYINEAQAWQAINRVLPQVKELFADWKEFGQSYMLGRALWSHSDSSIDGLFDIYKEALIKENSPWLKCPLHS